MMRSMWTAATGMKTQQFNIDTISHNLSNVNTNGFKSIRADFQDLLYTNIRRVYRLDEERRPVALEVGHGARPVATKRNVYTNGSLLMTEQPYDIGLNGMGYFVVDTLSGQRYTRDGSFNITQRIGDENLWDLVNNDGYYVMNEENEKISFNPDTHDLVIGTDGSISLNPKVDGVGEEQEIGKIKLVKFANPQGLRSIGNNLFAQTDNSGVPVLLTPENSETQTIQGYLEASNVQIVDEMVRMITAQRAYEINSKSITTSDEMLQTANQLKR